jgi:NhaP-type Na+/H+ or K+/H+ antiporter
MKKTQQLLIIELDDNVYGQTLFSCVISFLYHHFARYKNTSHFNSFYLKTSLIYLIIFLIFFFCRT